MKINLVRIQTALLSAASIFILNACDQAATKGQQITTQSNILATNGKADDTSEDDASTPMAPAPGSSTSASGLCGNGVVDPGEHCDGANLAEQTCQTLGYESGTLSCLKSCHFRQTDCGRCGDDLAQSNEECDGPSFNTSCVEQGFTKGGPLLCNADCTVDTSKCIRDNVCQDGVMGPNEECDKDDFGSQSCQSFGYQEGRLTCTKQCTVDTSFCRTCGNGKKDLGEECDGQDFGGLDCKQAGGFLPTNGNIHLFDGGQLSCTADCKLIYDKCCFSCQASECGDNRCGQFCGTCGSWIAPENCILDPSGRFNKCASNPGTSLPD